MKRLTRLLLACATSLLIVIALMGVSALPAAAAEPDSPEVNSFLCFPFTPNGSAGHNSTIYLANKSVSTATVVMNFYLADGAAAGSPITFQIPSSGTKKLELAAMDGLTQEVLHASLSADKTLVGVAHVHNADTGLIGVYSAAACGGVTNALYGPYAKGDPNVSAELHIANNNAEAVTLQADFAALSNGSVYSLTGIAVPANGSVVITDSMLPDNATLPAGMYTINAHTHALGVTGVLATQANGITTFAETLTTAHTGAGLGTSVTNLASVPRLYNGIDINGTAFSTALTLISTAAGSNTFTVNFYNADGSMGAAPLTDTFAAPGAKLYGGQSWPTLANGAYSAIAGSQNSLALHTDLVTAGAGDSSYAADSAVQPAASNLLLPGFVNNENAELFTIVTAQNTSPTPLLIVVQVVNEQGVMVKSIRKTVAPGAALAVDSRNLNLSIPFVGSASVVGSVGVMTQVDTFSKRIVNLPLTGVDITGPGLVMADQPAQFTATASPTRATTPISFIWQPSDLPMFINERNSPVDGAALIWQTPGAKTITVTAASALGSVVGTWDVRVPGAATLSTDLLFTLAYKDTSGAGITLTVPAGATSPGYTLTATPIAVQQALSMGQPLTEVNPLAAILLDVFYNNQPLSGFVFDQPATLRINYTAEQAGHAETTLRIFTLQNNQWVDAAETCNPPSTYLRQPEQNQISVQICHLSPFVLVEPAYWQYLPSLRK
jgi:hypothetical protein